MRRNITTAIIGMIVITASFVLGFFVAEKSPESLQFANMGPQNEMDSLMDIKFPRYEVYGLHQERDRQRTFIDHQYGFRYQIVGGCTVDERTRIEAETQNQKTDKIMTSRYGKDWMEKFEHSVDSMYAIDSIAIHIATTMPNYKKLDADTSLFNFKHIVFSTPIENVKLVEIRGDKKNDRTTYSYLRATVDIDKKKIINVDSQPYEYRY